MNEELRQYGLVPYFTQQIAGLEGVEERLARVTAVQRSIISVVTAMGPCAVRLCSGLRQLAAIDRPAVGDWVVLDQSQLQIEQVLERKSLFKRVAAGSGNEIQPIAANIDMLFIVTSCNEEFNESRLERYTTLCQESGAMPVIVLTKIDLVSETELDAYVRRAQCIQAGVAVEAVNTQAPATLTGLSAWIDATSTIALVGSSGVGKSTLLNSLAQNTLAATAEIRQQDKKGRHTTTHRELHKLPNGGLVIDVPGMRELRVAEIEDAIGTVFEDIELLSQQCQFIDCSHMTEPGCAVLKAIEDKRLDNRRLESYQKLLRENMHANASIAEKRTQGRDLAKRIKEVKSVKRKKGRLN